MPSKSHPVDPHPSPSLQTLAYLVLLKERMAQRPGLTIEQFNANLNEFYDGAQAEIQRQQTAKEGR